MSDDPSQVTEPSGDSRPALEGSVPFSIRQQWEFTRKELRETLRDRRTTVTLLIMPLLLYPMLGLGLRTVAFQQAADAEPKYELALATEAEATWLLDVLQVGQRSLEASEDAEQSADIQVLVPDDPNGFDLESAVADSAADLGVRVQFDGAQKLGGPAASVRLFQNEGSTLSRDASNYVERRLAAANVESIRQWAKQRGQPVPVLLDHTRVFIEPTESSSAILGLLPLVLLMMTVTGGVYPAIDLTAGERERNTMETLMALPVPGSRLLAAKYVAVVTVTMMTGLMNLIAMSVTLYALQLDRTLLGDGGFTLALGGKLFLALTAFSLFYSAVLLLLTSSARSFKEAQAYLIPLLLISIAPGLVIIMPGWHLTNTTAVLPLVNILLLAQELLQGTVQRLPAIVAVVSTILYGMSALSLAAVVFGNDAVAVGSRGRLRDFLHRPESSSTTSSLPAACLTLAVLFPAYFIASGVLSRGDAPPTTRLSTSAGLTAILFVILPWLSLRWQRVPVPKGLGLMRPWWPFWVAAVTFGLSVWPWVFELVLLTQKLGVRGISPEQIENVESLLASWNDVPLWVVVACLGIVPGICEEIFFRGYLFNGLRQHFNAVATIAFSAIAFGLFHLVVAGGAAPERVLPSTMMGLLLGWIAWTSGSTLPSIVLHAIHNSTLLIAAKSQDALAAWNVGQMEQEHLAWWWLAISMAVLLSAIATTRASRAGRPAAELIGT